MVETDIKKKRRKKRRPGPPKLEERDRFILEHVARYRMTVPQALSELTFFEDSGPHAVKNVLKRLCRSGGYLSSAPLYRNRSYYHLTKRAVRVLGEHDSLAKPLPDEPKTRAYAVLSFCCLQGRGFERLTKDEFEQHFPELYQNQQRREYYIDTAGDRPRLGFLRVDYGGRGRWDRLIAKCREDVVKRCDKPAFRKLIDAGDFVITVLTALEKKAERLRQAVAEIEAQLPVPIQVAVIPDLLELIAPPPQPTSRPQSKPNK